MHYLSKITFLKISCTLDLIVLLIKMLLGYYDLKNRKKN